jgi:hypothetical protein
VFIRCAMMAICVVASPQLLFAQLPSVTLSRIEQLALRTGVDYALRGEPNRARRIAINPMMVPAGEAPPSRGTKARDSERHGVLLRSFGATSAQPQSVINCASKPCTLRDVDMLLSLSEPQVSGSEASVTVTALQRVDGRMGTSYVTINVFLHREGQVWRVVRVEELGIS